MAEYTDAQMLWIFYVSLVFYLGPGIIKLVDLWIHRDRVKAGENIHVLRLPEDDEESRRAA